MLRLTYLGSYYLSVFWERLTGRQAWLRELGDYFKITPEQVLRNYQNKTDYTKKLWRQKPRRTKAQIFSFYQETDYFVYRQKWFNRYKAFWDIALPFLLKRQGKFCEYGSGIGPVTAWLVKFFPGWQYTLVDLDCPVFDFAKWRFRERDNINFKTVTSRKLPLTQKYDVITCKQVFEHVPNALELSHHLVVHLNPGGWLYLDYINEPGQENLKSSARMRQQVLAFLRQTLRPVFAIDAGNAQEGYGLYLKPNS